MNELLLRRRVARMESGPTEKSYIQDGLVFQLDGINKGSNVGYWTDIVGNKKFAYNEHVVVNNDNVQFLGTGYLSIDSDKSFARSTHTIEAVCSVATNGVVCGPTRRNIGIGFKSGRLVYSFGYSQAAPAYTLNGNSLSSFSVNNSYAYQNGQQLTSNANDSFGYNADTWHLGVEKQSTNIRNYYTGYVYAIRIYNRHLTADEILFNHKIDNERFNLGVTI